jgi:hypothetical protein
MGLNEGCFRVSLLPLPDSPETSSWEICCIISPATFSVTSAQMSITLLYRSPSVIRPSRYWFSISATSFRA